jgi:DNA-binding GntR family transcriptional regulator
MERKEHVGGLADLGGEDTLARIIASELARHVTTQDLVIASLRIAILTGALGPGERLRQEDLALRFRASRIPIREALRALEYEGLVISEPNRGSRVVELDPLDVEEVYDLRILLESEAIRLTAPLLDEHDFEDLELILDDIRAASDPALAIAARDHFFQRLYAVAGRRRLVDLIMRLRGESTRAVGRASVRRSVAVYEQILAALRDGDVDLAVDAVRAHLQRTSTLLRRSIRDSAERDRSDHRSSTGGRL